MSRFNAHRGPGRSALWFALLAIPLSTLLGIGAAAGDSLPAAGNLARDAAEAARRGQPVLVMFSMKNCAYCEAARRNYLFPLYDEAVIPIREIDVQSDAPIIDPTGKRTTARAWAQSLDAVPVPTVMVFGVESLPLAAPLRGFNDSFYGVYLDNMIEQGRRRQSKPGGG